MYYIYYHRGAMKVAKLFQNGQSQAVRLPKEFRFAGEFVYVKKSGNAVILLPSAGAWDSLVESLGKFSDDFPADRNQPESQDREAF